MVSDISIKGDRARGQQHKMLYWTCTLDAMARRRERNATKPRWERYDRSTWKFENAEETQARV